MSLSQQLQKLGLADTKAARRAEHARRQDQAQGETQARQLRLREEKQQQAEKQRQIQAQQAAERLEAERLLGITRMLQAGAVVRQPGDCIFHAVAQGKIKRLWLAERQYESLCSGQLRLGYWEGALFLLQAEDAERIAVKAPEAILPRPVA